MEVAINRLTKLRFPQGSEVWISGCPKFGATVKSRLTRPEASRTRLRPRHPPWPWGFDRLLSTSPWGLIVFLLLGFTAGVINVMRTAGVMTKQNERL